MSDTPSNNVYLTGSLASVFIKTATPIIIMMLVNGSFNLVDAYFLGVYVGADALTAVTSMFPAFMIIVALSTLVSNGFASVMARLLGADDAVNAKETFAQAITLSLLVSAGLIALFLMFGQVMTLMANNQSVSLSDMSYVYIAILIYGAPLTFILSINSDSLRCEGHVAFMAVISLSSVLLNALLNYVFIVQLDMGVAGSAYGTILAQLLVLVPIFWFRRLPKNHLKIQVVKLSTNQHQWRKFLALGAPSSLTYIGVALSSAAILYNLQQWSADSTNSYATTVGAYGIITRLSIFIFLPLLGLSMAFQTICGNNVGAKKFKRTNSCIKIALVCSLVYCVFTQGILWLLKDSLGGLFVDDIGIVNEVSRILPVSMLALFLLGPLMIITMFFQSIGDALNASILGLTKIYLFALPLVFILPIYLGEWGIWLAGPSSEVLALVLTIGVLFRRRKTYHLGLLYITAQT